MTSRYKQEGAFSVFFSDVGDPKTRVIIPLGIGCAMALEVILPIVGRVTALVIIPLCVGESEALLVINASGHFI